MKEKTQPMLVSLEVWEARRQKRLERDRRLRLRQRLALALLRSFDIEPEGDHKGRAALAVLKEMGMELEEEVAEIERDVRQNGRRT